MDRREFIKTAAVATAATAVNLKAGAQTAAPAEAGLSTVVAVRNGDPVTMFRKGIEALGGMKAFVKPGQNVVVKPNIAWDRTPEYGANTSPELVAEIVRQALAAGAGEVTVFDHTCNEWKSCYKNSGIEAAATEAGAKVVSAGSEGDYEPRTAEGAVKMKKALIHKALLAADVVINVPILKNHGGAKMTAAMKNWMGVVWDRGFMHRNNLPQCIADAILYRKPDLNVIDAYRVMLTNGPRGVGLSDVVERKYMLLSRDIVAIDSQAAKIMEYSKENVPYIALGEKLGLGTTDPLKMSITRIDA
ncbi:MAG: DUF362 domain-containing protein [Lentisphaerae bacterium]|jgi:uncharacterized protein (DUF362 family)|nr:DUF362 domain-containing protein [Lentisphaerota bacterium]